MMALAFLWLFLAWAAFCSVSLVAAGLLQRRRLRRAPDLARNESEALRELRHAKTAKDNFVKGSRLAVVIALVLFVSGGVGIVRGPHTDLYGQLWATMGMAAGAVFLAAVLGWALAFNESMYVKELEAELGQARERG